MDGIFAQVSRVPSIQRRACLDPFGDVALSSRESFTGLWQRFKLMGRTPDFQRITATITDGDIAAFYRSAAPDAVKQQVREAPDEETKKRFVWLSDSYEPDQAGTAESEGR